MTEKDVIPIPRTDEGIHDQGSVVNGLDPGTGREVEVEKNHLRSSLVLERSRETMIKKKPDMRIRRTRSMKLSTWRFQTLPKYFISLSWIQFWVRVKLLMNLLITVNPVMRRSSELLAVDQSWYRKLCRELFIFLFKVWHFRCCSSDCVIKWKM